MTEPDWKAWVLPLSPSCCPSDFGNSQCGLMWARLKILKVNLKCLTNEKGKFSLRMGSIFIAEEWKSILRFEKERKVLEESKNFTFFVSFNTSDFFLFTFLLFPTSVFGQFSRTQDNPYSLQGKHCYASLNLIFFFSSINVNGEGREEKVPD